ncbi:MAG: helix-turn-helix transcriptional regulator [Rouxiella aceris]|uniref:helix-turn-helix transcriptional regulator n=1 Tax=Rouxiella aceris TaxID=2703884 RepID=UPI00283D60DD|nr:helix-turn-helix transcriptional regulator [Rouxiella aceris]MDR3432475.1 helix-turn-helix transcriptional regulator [Rouxiella aceris]
MKIQRHLPQPNQALLSQLEQIAKGIGETFAPFCEVVVHDLLDPQHAILSIHNNLSGRQVGSPATELGLARIADPVYPQIIANYDNRFADGRRAKSTSIGIKDEQGRYVAALCLNVDLNMFGTLQNMLTQFCQTGSSAIKETLEPANGETLHDYIDKFAASRGKTPQGLKARERRELLAELKQAGYLEVRKAIDTIARHLGVSRATLYNDAKSALTLP